MKRLGVLLLAAIAILALVIGLLAFPSPGISVFHQALMFFALYGFMFLVITTLTMAFLKEFVQAFGKPFLKIHHTFAAVGLVFITVHPLLFAVESVSLAVLLPNLTNLYIFWVFAGSPAIITIYIAFMAALLRKKAVMHWKPFHMLIYIALFFGIVHANLLGRSLRGSETIAAIFDTLFAASVAAFALKRYQNRKLRKRNQMNHAPVQN